jgi:hypothetical protein
MGGLGGFVLGWQRSSRCVDITLSMERVGAVAPSSERSLSCQGDVSRKTFVVLNTLGQTLLSAEENAAKGQTGMSASLNTALTSFRRGEKRGLEADGPVPR